MGESDHGDWISDRIVAFQEMPSSPGLPAISREEVNILTSQYSSSSVKTTSAPLPQTADIGLGLYHDESGASTPLTSMSSSSSFADSSASIAPTTLTSSYSLPPLHHTHGTTSHPSQNEYVDPPGPYQHLNTPNQRLQFPLGLRSSSRTADLQRLSGFGSTPSLPSSSTPTQSQSFSPRISTPQNTSVQIPGSRLQSQSSPSLLQQTQLLNQPSHHQFDPFSPPRPQPGTWQNSFPSSQQPAFQPPHWGSVNAASSQQWDSRIPEHSQRPLSRPQLSTNTFGAPTGLQYGLQGAFLGTPIARDALLAYAHRLYNNPTNPHPAGMTAITHQPEPEAGSTPHIYHRQLLSLLDSIRSQHPHHLPTLLLLSCVYFSIGDYDACLNVCSEMLRVDPNYVRIIKYTWYLLITHCRLKPCLTWVWSTRRREPTRMPKVSGLELSCYDLPTGMQLYVL